ncbi:MAG TPA: creatininase family protein [Gemmatimonadales bacterium]|nr:creatininase family protein [Gemmatimonadales bacterium]
MTAPRPWILAEATWEEVRGTVYQVAVLPWGATEAHNRHLPYGTDTLHAAAAAERAAELAWAAGARVIVLPAVPFGVHTGQLDIPLCLNANPTTQLALLRDLTDSVRRAGIAKLVLVNGHGANDFRAMLRQLQAESPVFLATVNWYAAADAAAHFTDPGDHAGELETSVMQHLAPGLVRPLATAGPGKARRFRPAALREGWAWAPRHWSSVTDDTGVGDPRHADPARGAAFFDAATRRIAGFLTELAALDATQLYE